MSTSITIAGHPLNHAQQRTLMIVAAAQDVGICPAFHRPHETTYRRCAEELVGRGLLYRITGATEEGDDDEEPGYALTSVGEPLANVLTDDSGLDCQDIIPHPPCRPTADAGPAVTVTPIEVGMDDDEDESPYVILHGSQEATRAFAAHLYESIEVTITPSQERP